MRLLSLNRGAIHGRHHQNRKACSRVEQGQAARLEGPPEAEREIWAIRIRLQLARRALELALFNLAIDSKLRGCDLVGLRVHDVVHGSRVVARAIVMQKKTERPVQFEITEQTRDAVAAWITTAHLKPEQFLFPSRVSESPHLSTRQHSRITWPHDSADDTAARGRGDSVMDRSGWFAAFARLRAAAAELRR